MTAATDTPFDPAALRAASLPRLGTVYGVLMNDPAALAALGEAAHQPPYKAPPQAPVLYIKPRNTWAADGAEVVVPAGVESLQTGPALGVVIGRTVCAVSAAEALACIAGVTLVNDLSVPHASYYRPALRHKARDGFCPIGPVVWPLAALGDVDAASIEVTLDGRMAWRGTTRGFVRPLARLLADVTEFMTLHPGDVLMTGVPHGAPRVGPGQTVRISVAGLGTLSTRLVAEGAR